MVRQSFLNHHINIHRGLRINPCCSLLPYTTFKTLPTPSNFPTPQCTCTVCVVINLMAFSFLVQVVLGSAGFSDGGAQQLQYDITKFLVPLLARYCDTVPRKQLLERYMEPTKHLMLASSSDLPYSRNFSRG